MSVSLASNAAKPFPGNNSNNNGVSVQSSLIKNELSTGHAANEEDDDDERISLLLTNDEPDYSAKSIKITSVTFVADDETPRRQEQRHQSNKLLPTNFRNKNTRLNKNDKTHDLKDHVDVVTYWSLIRDNAPYRLYLASYITNYFGDWLTYLSSLSAIRVMLNQTEEGKDDYYDWQQHPQTLISYLVVVRLLTSVFFSPLGGVLADGPWDRRYVMIALDLCGAAIAWMFVWAAQIGLERQEQKEIEEGEGVTSASAVGVVWIFVATFCQQALSNGLYEPSRVALLPSLVMQQPPPRPSMQDSADCDDGDAVRDHNDGASNQEQQLQLQRQQQLLEKATIISGVAWSTVAAFGSATGGFLVTQFGVRVCFIADSVTYVVSALFMYYCMILDDSGGEYQRVRASINSKNASNTSCDDHNYTATVDSVKDDDHNDDINASKQRARGKNQMKVNPHDLKNHESLYSSLFESTLQAKLVSCWSVQFLYDNCKTMIWDGLLYTCQSFWGPLVFLKFSVLWLTLDVPNVKFSSSGHIADRTVVDVESIDEKDLFASPSSSHFPLDTENEARDEEQQDAFRLGLLFTGVGVGCFLGPLVAKRFTSMQHPHTLQLVCITCLGLSALACLGMGSMALFVPDGHDDNYTASGAGQGESRPLPDDTPLPWSVFISLCILTSLRAMGISAAWINSSLLLQTFSTPEMLGRVSSLDVSLAMLGECASALLSGRLEDDHGWSPFQICQGLGVLGLILWTIWMWFHLSGKGAAAAIAAASVPAASVPASSSSSSIFLNNEEAPDDVTSNDSSSSEFEVELASVSSIDLRTKGT